MDIAQPRWKEPEFSVGEINRAGKTVRDELASSQDTAKALNVIDNWRAAHAYPLHVFYMNLRKRVGVNSDILVVERLKRLDSIVGKLRREKGMELYRMQDLGGCRMILPAISDVYNYSDSLKRSDILHELKREYDYIKSPKASGYRSLHLVYKYHSDTSSKAIYNKYTMLIEIQFRTHLQHIWATAVETMGLFTNQAIKAGQGDEAIKRFFVIASSLFAIKEKCAIIPGTVEDVTKLISEIRQLNRAHHILDKLRAITAAIYHENQIPDTRGYCILQLNYLTQNLRIWSFRPSEFEDATVMYDELERSKGNESLDVVLIRGTSFREIKNAYPNYFLDIREFSYLIEGYLMFD